MNFLFNFFLAHFYGYTKRQNKTSREFISTIAKLAEIRLKAKSENENEMFGICDENGNRCLFSQMRLFIFLYGIHDSSTLVAGFSVCFFFRNEMINYVFFSERSYQ